jgi:hypothetical protein
MWISWDQLPPTSRIWIYPSTTNLESVREEMSNRYIRPFCESWKVHGQPLNSSFRWIDGYFLVLGVDETHQPASGCSIDSSVALIRTLQEEYKVDLMNRLYVHVWHNSQKLEVLAPADVPHAISENRLSSDSLVYQTALTQKSQLEHELLQPAGSTWLQRHFKNAITL